jgi:hypothetical protein
MTVEEPLGHRGPGRRVDEGVQRVPQGPAHPVIGRRGTADGRHRRREVAVRRRVRARHDRSPSGRRHPALRCQLGQHPPPPGQVAGVPGQYAQVAQRRRRNPGTVRIGIGERPERRQRGVPRQEQRGRSPRAEPDAATYRLAPGLRRRQRSARRARQVQRQ